VFSERYMKRCGGADPTSRGGAKTEGNTVDKNLAPFDIGADCHAGGAQ